jgi:hypothetical protein
MLHYSIPFFAIQAKARDITIPSIKAKAKTQTR